mgnify:CR=1 FL=1
MDIVCYALNEVMKRKVELELELECSSGYSRARGEPKRYGGKSTASAGRRPARKEAKRYGGEKDTAWPARKDMAGKRYGMAGAK